MIKSVLICLVLIVSWSIGFGQFAPQYPLDGHEAIHKSDVRIKAWATGIELQRGWMDIADTSLGRASAGVPENALGVSNVMVVSLGDAGIATLTFDKAIVNGTGPDFAVFENAFPDPEDSSKAFLELAFVEVSSDGIRFVRFPAICNFQTDSQISNFTYSDATLIHNLAGKYISGAGTPFDLEELKDSTGIDLNNIRYVRIVDITGSMDAEFASYDSRGEIINGPYPSPFPSAGFDLEAIAVLNQSGSSSINPWLGFSVSIYPNPAREFLKIDFPSAYRTLPFIIYDIKGNRVQEGILEQSAPDIAIKDLRAGVYILSVGSSSRTFVKL